MLVLSVLSSCSEFGLSNIPQVPLLPGATGQTGQTGDTAAPPELPPGAAEEPVYAHTATDLFSIDPDTGAREHIGTFRLGAEDVFGMVDIAIDLTGRMYGGTYDTLYQIDPTSAALSRICDLAVVPYALTFTSEGVLFAGAGHEVVEVDRRTCVTTGLSPAGDYYTSGDLVGLPDGFLYWTVRGTPDDQLVKVDPVTGATFLVGDVGEARLFGLGYAEGTLLGFSDGGVIVRIDPATGATTPLDAGPTEWWGATTNPVKW